MITKKYIKNKITGKLLKGASWLNNKTKYLSPLKKKIYLLLFCGFSGVVSTYILISAVLPKTTNPYSFIHSTSIAPHIGKTNHTVDPFISADTYQRVELF